MDANSTNTTDACSCGAPPSEWELLEDTVKKGRVWLNVVKWCIPVLAALIVVGLAATADLGAMIWPLGLGVLIIVKLVTKKPARSQVLKCRSCGASKVAPKN